jgi:hypothetical protein
MAKLKIIYPGDEGFDKGIGDGSIAAGADADAAIASLTPEEIEKELGPAESSEESGEAEE